MSDWRTTCDDPSHEPWEGPLRDDRDYAVGDKIRHDADMHAGISTAVINEEVDD